jgi:CotS family spore coat protein
LDTETLKKLLEEEYHFIIVSIDEFKNIYKITTVNGQYCLKKIKYNFSHFKFILEAIKYLHTRNFQYTPEIVKTKEGNDYIYINQCYCYLCPWVNSHKSDYSNEDELKAVSRKLAELHMKSRGFLQTKEMQPRVGWFKWIETFETRKNEIIDFKKRIYSKEKMNRFDKLYLFIMEEELREAENSIEQLKNSSYLEAMTKEIKYNGFCHHDLAYHNVLIGDNKDIYIIDFDYCILDSHLHDLSSLIIRKMKQSSWRMDNCKSIIKEYNSIYQIEQEELQIMAAFMEFPQDYWQRGIQYYWENKNWGEEFFIKKLNKYIEDREEKKEFIEELRNGKLHEII